MLQEIIISINFQNKNVLVLNQIICNYVYLLFSKYIHISIIELVCELLKKTFYNFFELFTFYVDLSFPKLVIVNVLKHYK